MPGFTARIDQITFNATLFSRAMETACRDLIKDAAKYWLIQVVNRIPIRTGFLVGAFSGLEDMLGITAPKFRTKILAFDERGKFTTHAKGSKQIVANFSQLKNKRLRLVNEQNDLAKRIRRLERRRINVHSNQGFTEGKHGVKSEFTSGNLSASEGAQDAQLHAEKNVHFERIEKENARIDARIRRLNKRYVELSKNIERINRYQTGSHSYVASKESFRGQSDVLKELNDLREQVNKLNNREKRRQGFSEFNPQVGEHKARFEKRYVDITREVEPSNKEKLDALRKRTKLEKKIEVLGTKLERFQTRAASAIFAHKEYYKVGAARILKTPRSGVQFATKPENVFKEYDTATRNLLTNLQSQQEARSNFENRDTSNPGEGVFGPAFTEQVNDAFKSSVASNLYKQILQTKSFFSFSFNVNISYYDVNDYYRTGRFGQKPMPWGSQQAGQIAFYQYLDQNALGKLPKITDFVHTSQITFAGQNAPSQLRKDVVS